MFLESFVLRAPFSEGITPCERVAALGMVKGAVEAEQEKRVEGIEDGDRAPRTRQRGEGQGQARHAESKGTLCARQEEGTSSQATPHHVLRHPVPGFFSLSARLCSGKTFFSAVRSRQKRF